MSDDSNQVLTRAYELIESDHLDEAKALLDPILEANPDSPDAWWLYAHAVQDVETARKALQNVLRIDPDYPGANDLLKASEGALAPAPSARPIQLIDASQVPAIPPDLPPTLPEKVGEAGDFEGVGEVKQTTPRTLIPRWLAILISVVAIAIVCGLLLLISPPGPTSTGVSSGTPDEQASVPTLPVSDFTPLPVDTIIPSNVTGEDTSALPPGSETSVPIVTVTPIGVTEEVAPAVSPAGETTVTNSPVQEPTSGLPATGDPYEPINAAVSGFTVPRNAIAVSATELGETLLVSICTQAGPDLRAALPEAMKAIASASQSLTSEIDAVGTRMMDCSNNTTLLVIAVPLEDAQAYANGELDDEAFQARWTSL